MEIVCPACGKENPADARFCNACGRDLAEVATAVPDTRRMVSVVFCDLTGSTALGDRTDPEPLRRIMGRYYDVMRGAVEAHGGTVEKFIGDAVMAVFGIPRIHEDDAVRAVRAAAGMREALVGLNHELEGAGVTLQTRIGVNTGEVVAGDPASSDSLITGDAVNVAARLEQAAGPGEILIGAETYRLVRDAVTVEPLEPLSLKGKPDGVIAFRLRRVDPMATGHARRLDSPMVGRARPLGMLRSTFTATVDDRGCSLFTVLGPAGIGKTRLVREFLDGLGSGATVLRGRCLSYGEGITYWAVGEMVSAAAGLGESDAPEDAQRKIVGALARAPDAERIGAQLAALLGLTEATGEVEAAWAVRRLLETLAMERPVVAYVDDLHWAEPGLLDALEHVADLARDVPILLLCTSRPELLEARPGWGGGKLRAATVHLEPLDDAESDELIGNLLSHPALTDEIRRRIRETARGNPLFVEEMLAMLVDEGAIAEVDGAWVATTDLAAIDVPPAISALLAARLDRLGPGERAIVEAAAVIGEVFERDGTEAIAGAGSFERDLVTLVRKDLVVPSPSAPAASGEALRFRHVLIREAAYAGVPKERRAELHEAFADWLTGVVGERVQGYDEVLGYHLEQAHMLRVELGLPTEDGLVERASMHLGRAGSRARARGDASATATLLLRAARLDPLGPDRLEALIASISSASEAIDHRSLEEAARLALADAEALGDPALLARVRTAEIWARFNHDPVTTRGWDEVREVARAAIDVLERAGDHRGLAEAWLVLAWTEGGRAQYEQGMAATRVAQEHARAIGDRYLEMEAATTELGWMEWGPTPVREALARTEEIREHARGDRNVLAEAFVERAAFLAMQGRIEEAREDLAEGIRLHADLGQEKNVAYTAQTQWHVEWLAGDHVAAAEVMRRSVETLERHGGHALIDLHHLMRAHALATAGRLQEAEAIVDRVGAIDPDDLTDAPIAYRVRALVASARGEHVQADRLNREAVAIGEGTNGLFDLAWTYIERGEILRAAGRHEEASAALTQAIRLADRKGDVMTAAFARELLAELE
ncbi:MAG TPA: adenylate/guanylate cyclase domain-containing protein [Actinomycetota bacterium]